MSQSQDQSEFFRGTANVGTEFKDGVESLASGLFVEGLSALVAAAVLENLACQWRS
jgi:hypothetical protein